MTSTSPPADPDALDRLLRRFFKQQMPAPWPRPKALEPYSVVRPTAPATLPIGNRHSALISLAASVALLVGACWSFVGNGVIPGSEPSGFTPADEAGNLFNGSKATPPADMYDDPLFVPMGDGAIIAPSGTMP